MRNIILVFCFFAQIYFSQDMPEMKVYVKNNKMEKGYRVLKTTIKDS